MRLQVLGSGSRGNAALLWADETLILIDAGLGIRTLTDRLAQAGVGLNGIDHVVVTHGHLDHSRSAGIIAKRHRATLHCAQVIQAHRSLSRAPDVRDLPIGGSTTLEPRKGSSPVQLTTVKIPHDCEPTVGLRFDHEGATLSLLSDMGEPTESAGRVLANPELLVLESNHDEGMLARGPYPDSLKRRVRGTGGHLSNDQMAVMLRRLIGPRLHTVVLAHLSEKNNRPELALEAAGNALAGANRSDVRVLVAPQGSSLEPIVV
ncbi:MAG: MBL fold metallo-hydrolase [Planctomycetota bacterium]